MAKQKKSRAEEEMRYPNLVAFSKCMDENGDIHDENINYHAVMDEIEQTILAEEVDADSQFLLVAMKEAAYHQAMEEMDAVMEEEMNSAMENVLHEYNLRVTKALMAIKPALTKEQLISFQDAFSEIGI